MADRQQTKKENPASRKKSLPQKLWNNIRSGDRVVWIVTILLIMLSLVAIFSSTSSLAITHNISRMSIFVSHLKVVGLGAVILIACSAIPSIKPFRAMSKWGFILSLTLLLLLVGGVRVGSIIRPTTINGATRALKVFGFSLQVYEVVKIAMVMYLAWAVQTYESGSFKLANRLSLAFPKVFGWLRGDLARRWVFIFGPIMLVTVLIFPGSTGSALLTCIVMFATVLIGGMKWEDILKAGAVAIAGIAILVGAHIVSSGEVLSRMSTAFNRLGIEVPYPSEEARLRQRDALETKQVDPSTIKLYSQEFYDYLGKVKQPLSAEIAIVEGGRMPLGKGPGKSTQKYVVPVMFEDYMFSFIVEEYGLVIGILVIIMYMSLFARGMIIVHNSSNRYAKACVGGLVFLITFQALFHVLVNCNVGIVTGQTLPLISHGRCSFLCFSFALGVVLCTSVLVNRKIKNQQKAEAAELTIQTDPQEKDAVQISEPVIIEEEDESDN